MQVTSTLNYKVIVKEPELIQAVLDNLTAKGLLPPGINVETTPLKLTFNGSTPREFFLEFAIDDTNDQ